MLVSMACLTEALFSKCNCGIVTMGARSATKDTHVTCFEYFLLICEGRFIKFEVRSLYRFYKKSLKTEIAQLSVIT